MDLSFLKNWIWVVTGLLLMLLLGQCATPGSLTGGVKDETPPQVVAEKSTPDGQTNFYPEEIQLTFDEWVRLKDVGRQVIISPPFRGYEVRLKGKSLLLEFGDKDTLRKNVTYVVQFGEAVQDLTENNPAENLRFVFSTGPYIDSLAYQGTVVDAYSAEPVKDVLLLLYDNLNDTVFQKDRPLYFGRTNEEGQFSISNLRAGRYLVRALEDADANYRYNQASEALAFLPEPLLLPLDTLALLPDLRLFQTVIAPQLISIDSSTAGVLQIVFDQELDRELLTATTPTPVGNPALWQSVERDTLWLWQQEYTDKKIFLAYDTLLYDTLRLPAAPAPGASDLAPLATRRIPADFRQGNPLGDFRLGFSRPLVALDTARVQFRYDTLDNQALRWRMDSVDQRQLAIRPAGAWGTTGRYQLTLLPNAVTDIWGRTNSDTITEQWSITARRSLGNLSLEFTTDEPDQYFLVLVRQAKKAPVARLRLQGSTSYEARVEALPPGDYQLEIIRDDNGNGRWDTGSYTPKRLPEQVIIKPLETLRANWDLVLEVEL